jgi:hypothetical protein
LTPSLQVHHQHAGWHHPGLQRFSGLSPSPAPVQPTPLLPTPHLENLYLPQISLSSSSSDPSRAIKFPALQFAFNLQRPAAPTAIMVNWNAEKDQIVTSASRHHLKAFAHISQILKGIFKFHDIKSSAPLLKYLAEQIGEGKSYPQQTTNLP